MSLKEASHRNLASIIKIHSSLQTGDSYLTDRFWPEGDGKGHNQRAYSGLSYSGHLGLEGQSDWSGAESCATLASVMPCSTLDG